MSRVMDHLYDLYMHTSQSNGKTLPIKYQGTRKKKSKGVFFDVNII